MGTNDKESFPNERPAHLVQVNGFWMDVQDVTNAEFAKFVEATAYVTTAECSAAGGPQVGCSPPGRRIFILPWTSELYKTKMASNVNSAPPGWSGSGAHS